MRSRLPLEPEAEGGENAHAPWVWLSASAALIACLYVVLGLTYSALSSSLAAPDTYFGTDIDRHVRWTTEAEFWRRGPLHPASLVLFKGHGAMLRALGVLPGQPPLVVLALPVVIWTALGLVAALHLIEPRDPTRPVWFLLSTMTALIIGPSLLLAPVPESHTLGGVALLLQTALLLAASGLDRREERGGRASSLTGAALLFGGLATGFTLSNLVPAAVVMCLAPPAERRRFLRIGGCAALMLGALLLGLMVFKLRREATYNPLFEATFMIWPSLGSFANSLHAIVLSQFGPPLAKLVPAFEADRGTYRDVIAIEARASVLQGAALALWACGIALWLRCRRGSAGPERRFVAASGLALLSIVGLHAVYANHEPFMFSAHAWPFVLLPGLVAWTRSVVARYRAPAVCLTAAIVLSAIQLAVGFPHFLKQLERMRP